MYARLPLNARKNSQPNGARQCHQRDETVREGANGDLPEARKGAPRRPPAAGAAAVSAGAGAEAQAERWAPEGRGCVASAGVALGIRDGRQGRVHVHLTYMYISPYLPSPLPVFVHPFFLPPSPFSPLHLYCHPPPSPSPPSSSLL